MENIQYPVINGTYNHYKGGIYKVLTLCTHTENEEVLVIYRSLLFGSVYARPLKMWFEKVKKDENSGQLVSRFILQK